MKKAKVTWTLTMWMDMVATRDVAMVVAEHRRHWRGPLHVLLFVLKISLDCVMFG
jgi:hypothetical protein